MKQILFALLLITIYANAAPADPTPFKVLQPSGDSIIIRLIGDEYGSWYQTTDGKLLNAHPLYIQLFCF